MPYGAVCADWIGTCIKVGVSMSMIRILQVSDLISSRYTSKRESD